MIRRLSSFSAHQKGFSGVDRIGTIILAWAAIQSGAVFAAPPPVLTLARPQDQARFRVTTFSSGLSFPTSMAQLADGSVLVGASDGATFFGSTTGRLLRLSDIDGNGIADGPAQTLASGLPGLVTSVRTVGNVVVALSSQPGKEAITLWRMGNNATDPFTAAGSIQFSFPSGASNFQHTTYALAARPLPSNPLNTEVFFNIGSQSNAVSTPANVTVSIAGSGVSGLPGNQLAADSIYRIVLSDNGTQFSSSLPQQIAAGLRNAAGMTFSPNGDLFLQDNGIDTPGNPDVSFSADELNRIEAAILGTSLPDFGFAGTYIDYATGAVVGPMAGITMPLVAFRPLSSERSEGAVEVAMAPSGFGMDFADGLFVSFFGNFLGGAANDENPVVFADPVSGNYFHFIENQLLGHPYGLLSTADSLFLADISYTGSLFTSVEGVPANQAGVIYQITALKAPLSVPGPLPLLGVGAAFGWSRRLQRRLSARGRLVQLGMGRQDPPRFHFRESS